MNAGQEPLFVVCVDYGNGAGPKLGNHVACYSSSEVDRAGAQILGVFRRSVSAKTRLVFRNATPEEREAFENRT